LCPLLRFDNLTCNRNAELALDGATRFHANHYTGFQFRRLRLRARASDSEREGASGQSALHGCIRSRYNVVLRNKEQLMTTIVIGKADAGQTVAALLRARFRIAWPEANSLIQDH